MAGAIDAAWFVRPSPIQDEGQRYENAETPVQLTARPLSLNFSLGMSRSVGLRMGLTSAFTMCKQQEWVGVYVWMDLSVDGEGDVTAGRVSLGGGLQLSLAHHQPSSPSLCFCVFGDVPIPLRQIHFPAHLSTWIRVQARNPRTSPMTRWRMMEGPCKLITPVHSDVGNHIARTHPKFIWRACA